VQLKRGLQVKVTSFLTSGRICRASSSPTLWSCSAATVASTAGCVRADVKYVVPYLRHLWSSRMKAQAITYFWPTVRAPHQPTVLSRALRPQNAPASHIMMIGRIPTMTKTSDWSAQYGHMTSSIYFIVPYSSFNSGHDIYTYVYIIIYISPLDAVLCPFSTTYSCIHHKDHIMLNSHNACSYHVLRLLHTNALSRYCLQSCRLAKLKA